jgi:hypothetical protein
MRNVVAFVVLKAMRGHLFLSMKSEKLKSRWMQSGVTSLHQRKASLTVKELPTPIPMAIW